MQIRGVGRWTAVMTTEFAPGRWNVFSINDVSLQNNMKRAYGFPSSRRDEYLDEEHERVAMACIFIGGDTKIIFANEQTTDPDDANAEIFIGFLPAGTGSRRQDYLSGYS